MFNMALKLNDKGKIELDMLDIIPEVVGNTLMIKYELNSRRI